MPKFRVTSPDGQSWEVSAPEGATADQALAFAQQQWKATQAPKAPKPQAEDPGFLRSALIGAGRTFDRVGKGAQQAYYAATGNQKALDELKSQAAMDDAAYAPLKDLRPVATGLGEFAPWAPAALVGGGATLGATALRQAAVGAVPGAIEYGSAGERGQKAALGAAFGAAVPLAAAGLKTGKAFIEPMFEGGRQKVVGRLLNQVAGDDAASVASRLRTASPLVPGSIPTAGQVAESGGIAALERAAAQANPQAYTTRAMEQASARLNALRGIAGDDASMAAAEAARKAATADAYKAATQATYTVDPALADLIKRPAVQQAMGRAKTLAENQGRDFTFGVTARNPNANPKAWGGAPTSSSTQITGQGLQDLKMAMDEMLADPTSGFTGKSAGAVRDIRNQLVNWMEGANPEFKAARSQYAELSKPINQMQVGRQLLDKISPALSDFGALGQETGAQFARAMRNADQTVRTATQFRGAGSMADVMTPQQMRTLNAIGQDLARKANAQNLGRGVGSDTFQKIAMNNIAQQSGLPRLAGGLLEMPGISRATRWIYQDADQKAQGLLADALLDPQRAGLLMENASKQSLLSNSPKARKALEESLLRSGLLGIPYVNAPVEP